MASGAGDQGLDLTEIGFADFDNLTLAVDWGWVRTVHGLADAMAHEPSGLVSDLEHAVKLMSRGALLAPGHQFHDQNPLMQGDMAALKYGTLRDAELTAVRAALEETRAVGVARQPGSLPFLYQRDN